MKARCPFCKKVVYVEYYNPETRYTCPHCGEYLGKIKPLNISKPAIVNQAISRPIDNHNNYLIDYVATELKSDINYLNKLDIKLDIGKLSAKTGGVAWAGFEAFTGDWLSALVVGGIALLSGGIADGYKRIKLQKMRQKWVDRFSELDEHQLAYLAEGLRCKYPLLLGGLQKLIESGQ